MTDSLSLSHNACQVKVLGPNPPPVFVIGVVRGSVRSWSGDMPRKQKLGVVIGGLSPLLTAKKCRKGLPAAKKAHYCPFRLNGITLSLVTYRPVSWRSRRHR